MGSELPIACAHNCRYNGWRHFWGARFKSILLEDEAALMRVNQYIEANPVKAGMVEKPSECEHCSAGQLARALEREEEVPELEPRAWLANYKPEFRAKAYVLTQDYLAWLYHNPEMRRQPKPPEYACLDFANFDMDQYEKDLNSGALTNSGRGVCGSDEFIERMNRRPKSLQTVNIKTDRPNRRKTGRKNIREGGALPKIRKKRQKTSSLPKKRRKKVDRAHETSPE